MAIKKCDFFQLFYQPTKEKEIIKQLIMELDEKEANHVIKTANDVLNHSFLFDMEWDMERTHEPVVFKGDIVWDILPKDDHEFTWQFNRHRFLMCLAQAYFLTSDEKYVEGFLELIKDFMRTQGDPTDKRNTTWRILEIGIRSGNWLKSLYLIQDSPLITDELLSEVYDFLVLHAEIIFNEHNPYCYAGNWGVLENHGLFLMGTLLPQNEQIVSYRKQALEVLGQAMNIQILPDGVQVEQSSMYHNEVLRCMLEVILFAKLADIPLKDDFVHTIHKMAEATRYLLKPNGTEIAGSDSDTMNGRPVLQLAATIFEDSKLKFSPTEDLSYDNIWLLLESGRRKLIALPYRDPDRTSLALWESGHYLLRSSWQTDADLLHFDCGSIGTSHGHSDLLHTDWVVEGEDVLVDPGRYTYVDKPERYQFKNLKAHNTFIVDETQPHKWFGSFHSNSGTTQMKSPFLQKDGYSFIEAGHSGFMHLDNPVWVTRRIIHLSPELYLVVDDSYTSGTHTYEQYYHFDAGGHVTLSDNVVLFKNKKNASGVILDQDMSFQLIDTEQANFYNEKIPNKTVLCKKKATGNQTYLSLLVKNFSKTTTIRRGPVVLRGRENPFKKDMVEGVTIHHKDEVYRIILGKVEMASVVDLYEYEGCLGCGKVIVFGPNDSTTGGVVLSW
ncbi:heparinase II/III family protein [Niallia taxi]|uniref:alginate lyase family protein n=1 Tax=Niallia taxi TaxID=2499688 RepID=UPI0020419A09|nr:alginate lyase family protein [Niallia taxi]MCM3213194.1 heparinase II/III family protein [Niallia taxi]